MTTSPSDGVDPGARHEPSRARVSTTADAALQPFFDRLSRHADIGDACRAALAVAFSVPRQLEKGACVAGEGEPVTALTIVCDGLVLDSRRLPSGLQQHVAIRAPGQVLDQAGYVLAQAGVSTCALIRAVVASAPRPVLSAVLDAHPALGEALTWEMAADARVAQEWMVSMGRRSALARVAHLLCEVRTRLEEVGMAGPSDCPFPLTQSDLADTVGLSVVHTNRVLQQLRREEMIVLARGRLEVRDWAGLVNAAGFDAGYLQAPRRG